MKSQHLLLTFFLMLAATFTFGQNKYVGTWKTIDDNTKEAKSYVKIYESDGKLYGQVTEILNPAKKGSVCENCTGAKHNKPVEGLVILEGLKAKKDYYTGGTITDPENGKEYSCYIELVNDKKLKVRGYIGVAALGRTQYWHKLD